MKKKEYLPFHAKVLFAISTQLKKPIIWSVNKEDKINEIGNSASYYADTTKTIKNENELLVALESGAKACKYYFYAYKEELFEAVLLKGNEEQIGFFVKQNNSLSGEYGLAEINKILPKLDDKKAFIMFTEGSNTFGVFNQSDFEKTVELVKNYPRATEMLNSYIEKRSKSITHEYIWIGIRSNLIEHFPNKLKDFYNLPIIKDYLDSLEEKPNPFIETEIDKTIYLRVNCETLKKAYPLSFGTFNFYTGSLKKLIKAFEKNGNDTGVIKTHVNDSIPSKTGYQYTHIYININDKSRLNENAVKEIIAEYYGEYLANIDSKDFYQIDNFTDSWVRTKLLYNELNKEVVANSSSEKRSTKI